MPDRSSSICRYGILAAAIVAATGGIASVGRSQQLSGSIGASLTILAPIAAPPLRVVRFDVGSDGVARLETTLPSAGRMSQVVMVRASDVSAGSMSELHPAPLVSSSSGVMRTQYRITIGRGGSDLSPPTAVRVEYLIVAGT